MQITFHLPVVVYGSPGRTTNQRDVVGYVPVVHDVPVLTDHDAPLALSYIGLNENAFETAEELRCYEGGLIRAVTTMPAEVVTVQCKRHGRDEDGLFVTQLEHINEVVEKVRKSGRGSLVAPQSFADFVFKWEESYEFAPLVELAVKGDYQINLNEQVDAFRNRIAKLVVVGDRFYLPEAEPVLKLTEWFGDLHARVVRGAEKDAFGVVKGTGRELASLGYFRMDQEAEMNAEAQALNPGGRLLSHVKEISVYDPSLLVANVEAMTLAELAATFAQRFLTQLLEDDCSYEQKLSRLGKALAAVPASQIALYQRLVKGIDLFKSEGDVSELEAAVFAVTESDPTSLERFYFFYRGNVSRYADEITRRWNDREVSLERDLQMVQSSRLTN